MHCEAIHCPDSETVRFAIYPDGFDGPRIMARIEVDALQDRFGAGSEEESLLSACDSNFDLIEAMALQRYEQCPFEAVVLTVGDFAPAAFIPTTAMLGEAATL